MAKSLTVRQRAKRFGGYGGLSFVEMPQSIADEMEEWLATETFDGCVDKVAPQPRPPLRTSGGRGCGRGCRARNRARR